MNLVRIGSRKLNEIRISENESPEHAAKKTELCSKLGKQGKHFVTEAIFADGSGRADILVLDDFKVYEIVCSEKEGSIIHKQGKYPAGLRILVVRA